MEAVDSCIILQLSEMKAPNVNDLIYLCYSAESNTAFHVTFDGELWSAMWDEMIKVFGGDSPTKPKYKSKQIDHLKKL